MSVILYLAEYCVLCTLYSVLHCPLTLWMVLCLCVWPSDGRSQLDFCPSVLYVLSVKLSVFRETKTEHNVVPQGEAVWFVAFLPVLMPSPNLTVTSKSHSLLMSGIIYLHFYASCCHLLVLLLSTICLWVFVKRLHTLPGMYAAHFWVRSHLLGTLI